MAKSVRAKSVRAKSPAARPESGSAKPRTTKPAAASTTKSAAAGTAKRTASKSRTPRHLTMPPPLPFSPVSPARPFVDRHAVAATGAADPTLADVQHIYSAPAPRSPANVTGDPTQNLQRFVLEDLAQFTRENVFSANASKDVHLFYVGRDNVHEILKYILSRVTISLYINMFGFDDSELNNILMEKALNPAVTMLITLDQSQSKGVHEKALLEADQKYNLAAYNTHFVVGESLTHQISHTKGFVADGRVAAEGSTNWSNSGEGTFVVEGQAGGAGYKAQNNTQSVITDPDTIVRFQTELIAEHMVASSMQARTGRMPRQIPLETTPATEAMQQDLGVAAPRILAPGMPSPNSAGAGSTAAAKRRRKPAAAAAG